MAASRYICLICRNPIPHAGAECPHCSSRASAVVGATPQLLIAVFAVMMVLIIVTNRYDAAFDRKRAERSRQHFQIARTLSDYGNFEDSIEHYRDALLDSRENDEYRRGLSLALYYSGRFQEAENQLLQLRAKDPTDAVSNRLLARLAAKNGRTDEAISYFRTAVYGRWEQNPEENRVAARFELIELLEVEGTPLQVVSEVLSLLQEEPADADTSRRAARILLDFGAPQEAARLYSRLLETDPGDANIIGGLGRARFELGEYAEAERLLRDAQRKEPNDDVRYLLGVSQAVLALDPTTPRLPRTTRYERSREVLERTLRLLDSCINPWGDQFIGPPSPQPAAVSSTLRIARERLEARRRPSDLVEATETNLLIATNLWGLRDRLCTNFWDEDEALGLVMKEVAR